MFDKALYRLFRNKLTEKLKDVTNLIDKITHQSKELERAKVRAEIEEQELWKRLDVIRDKLNTETVWFKMWEIAFDKAFDMVWDTVKEKTVALVKKSYEDAYSEAEKNLTIHIDKKFQDIMSKCETDVNVPLLFKRKDEIYQKYLNAERVNDIKGRDIYNEQLKLLKEVINNGKDK